MRTRYLILFILIYTSSLISKEYYFHPVKGKDTYKGISKNRPFKSLDKIQKLDLKAGDIISLASGNTFFGTLRLKNMQGSEGKPIVVQTYTENSNRENNKATINFSNYLDGILISDCKYVIVKDITLIANGGHVEDNNTKVTLMRSAIRIRTSKAGEYGNIVLKDLLIEDIFYEKKGFIRTKSSILPALKKQNYGWGIRVVNRVDDALLSNIIIDSCIVRNIAHTGIKFTGKDKSINKIQISNNIISKTGGPGIQISYVDEGQIHNNEISFSGSNDDSRKLGRGSGLWTWNSSNMTIEHNSFTNANGPGDSAGCHIDFNCRNIIVQYNFSANNAGGFCEILGNNHNCSYRYNISVNDGHRVKGKNNAFQEGKILWLSGYRGKNRKQKGPFNTYFYNNTIYVKKDIVAKIAVSNSSDGILIANNIFCFEGKSQAVIGDQSSLDTYALGEIKNLVFENNLYLKEDNWPEKTTIQDTAPIIGNIRFCDPGSQDPRDYLPLQTDLIKDKGIVIEKLSKDPYGLFLGLDVKSDILGNKISNLPDIGAIETIE